MLFRIDPSSDVALFEQLAASVRTQAATGALRPGQRLPAARDVAVSLGINLHTVLRAYQQLRDEGLLDMRRGRGAIVTDAVLPLAELRGDVAALVRRATQLGLTPEALAALVKETARKGDPV